MLQLLSDIRFILNKNLCCLFLEAFCEKGGLQIQVKSMPICISFVIFHLLKVNSSLLAIFCGSLEPHTCSNK